MCKMCKKMLHKGIGWKPKYSVIMQKVNQGFSTGDSAKLFGWFTE